MEKISIDGIEKNLNMAKVTLFEVPDKPGVASEIFGALGQQGISVELLVTNAGQKGHSNISFAVLQDDLETTREILEKSKDSMGTARISVDPNMALISIHGQKLAGVPGVAGKIFHTLASSGINIDSISSSRTTVTCLIAQDKIEQAVASLQTAFQLSQS
ncbi:ACT domain-containing protein [bacterium]|nr:ACT domain-containing protein [bacterium]